MALFSKKNKEKENKKLEEKEIDESVALPSAPSLPKGGDAHSYQVVLSPHITEKGTVMGEQNKYIFKVAEGANKVEIKKAIGSLYKVDVAKVRILYAKAKFRQVGRHEGNKPGFKKAIVTLKRGSKIDTAS